jgi:hypothetical protein
MRRVLRMLESVFDHDNFNHGQSRGRHGADSNPPTLLGQPTPCPKGRCEYIPVSLSPASMPDTPLGKATGCLQILGVHLASQWGDSPNDDYGRKSQL